MSIVVEVGSWYKLCHGPIIQIIEYEEDEGGYNFMGNDFRKYNEKGQSKIKMGSTQLAECLGKDPFGKFKFECKCGVETSWNKWSDLSYDTQDNETHYTDVTIDFCPICAKIHKIESEK